MKSFQVCLCVTAQPELTDETFRSHLLDHPDEVLAQFKSLTPRDISQWSHEQLCYLMDDADYDPAVAARESESGLFLDLHVTLTELRSRMEQGGCTVHYNLSKFFVVGLTLCCVRSFDRARSKQVSLPDRQVHGRSRR